MPAWLSSRRVRCLTTGLSFDHTGQVSTRLPVKVCKVTCLGMVCGTASLATKLEGMWAVWVVGIQQDTLIVNSHYFKMPTCAMFS